MIRHCNTCNLDKSIALFYPSYKTQCKACLKAKFQPHLDAKKRYLDDYRAANPNAFREWAAKNTARRSVKWAEWYAKNKAHRSESYRRWARDNKHIVNAVIARRVARKLKATPSWVDIKSTRHFYRLAAELTKTTGVRHEVDHIVPLQGKLVCGLHYAANMQILTKTENIRKGNRWQVQQP